MKTQQTIHHGAPRGAESDGKHWEQLSQAPNENTSTRSTKEKGESPWIRSASLTESQSQASTSLWEREPQGKGSHASSWRGVVSLERSELYLSGRGECARAPVLLPGHPTTAKTNQ